MLKQTSVFRLLVAATAAVVLSGGFAVAQRGPVRAAPLPGTQWVVAAVKGQPAGPRMFLMFDKDTFAANDGCNGISGGWRGGVATALSFKGPFPSTLMACRPEVMTLAVAFRDALTATKAYRRTDDKLAFLDGTGAALVELVPQPQTLGGTSWNVVGYNNGQQAVVNSRYSAKMRLVISEAGKIEAFDGCRTFTGATKDGAAPGAVTIEGLASSEPECASVPDEQQAAGRQFIEALQKARTFRRVAGTLELRSPDGAMQVSLRERPAAGAAKP